MFQGTKIYVKAVWDAVLDSIWHNFCQQSPHVQRCTQFDPTLLGALRNNRWNNVSENMFFCERRAERFVGKDVAWLELVLRRRKKRTRALLSNETTQATLGAGKPVKEDQSSFEYNLQLQPR